MLGHGAGGGVASADLLAVTSSAVEAGWRVLRVEQPRRVAGKRNAPAPQHLDVAWTADLGALRAGVSARVACTHPMING